MLLLLTIALVVVGAVSLLIGFVNDAMFPIYLSIGCSVLAAVVLLVFSRISRTRLEPSARPATAAAGGAGAETAVMRTDTASFSRSGGDDGVFPIADYDDLRVSEILPLLPELDLDELELVREREETGRSRASILRRIDELTDDLDGAAPEPTSSTAADDDLFPIEDYDDLRVSEILPLLDELEPDELEDVAARERAGSARASILGRVDELLGRGAPEPTIAATRVASATKAPAKKATKKAASSVKKAAATGAKKTAAKKTAAKKTAGTAKKAAAKKTTKKAGGTKKA